MEYAQDIHMLNSTDAVNDNYNYVYYGEYYRGADSIIAFHNRYKHIHGPLAVSVCTLGMIANLLNIIVLTRRKMMNAVNCILTALAVSDGLTMAIYLPFALRFYCFYDTDPNPERNSLGAVRFLFVYACSSVFLHACSIWLTVTLAVFRYIFVKFPHYGATICTLTRAKLAVALVYVTTFLVCVPNLVSTQVVAAVPTEEHMNSTVWVLAFRDVTLLERIVKDANFWIQAMLKLVPCVGLVLLSGLLVREMKRTEANYSILQRQRHQSGNSHRLSVRSNSRRQKTNRTTRMLLAVVIIFLLTEFPQGVLNLLSGMLPYFVDDVYAPLGDLMDILALFNNGVNFVLYCSMSSAFRKTFVRLFGCRPRRSAVILV